MTLFIFIVMLICKPFILKLILTLVLYSMAWEWHLTEWHLTQSCTPRVSLSWDLGVGSIPLSSHLYSMCVYSRIYVLDQNNNNNTNFFYLI